MCVEAHKRPKTQQHQPVDGRARHASVGRKRKASGLLLLLILRGANLANHPLHAILQAITSLRRARLDLPRTIAQGVEVQGLGAGEVGGMANILVFRCQKSINSKQTLHNIQVQVYS